MPQLTFEIIGLACFAYLVSYKVFIGIFKITTKPFSCPLCIALWISLVWFTSPYIVDRFGLVYFVVIYDLQHGILYAAIASVLAGIIERRA